MVCIKSHNPHSSPYPATAAQQVTACSLSYSTSDHHVQCRAAMPHLFVPHKAEAWNSLQRMTKVSNRPIITLTVDALLYSVHVSCKFYALYWKWWPKVGGPIHCWSPQPKSWGDLSPPVRMVVAPMVPWLKISSAYKIIKCRWLTDSVLTMSSR